MASSLARMHLGGQRHQHKHRQAQPSRGREEAGVAMGIHKLPRKPGNELGQQQHHGAQQRVLRGRIADVGQRRHIGNERCRSDEICSFWWSSRFPQ